MTDTTDLLVSIFKSTLTILLWATIPLVWVGFWIGLGMELAKIF